MEIYTAGFAGWSARGFFGALKDAGIKRVIDIRLHNTSQLAGFAKRDDLEFFLEAIAGAEYLHEPLLAPTEELFKGIKTKAMKWPAFERAFLDLLKKRSVKTKLDRSLFAVPTLLFCSEHKAADCHRRLVAEHLAEHWKKVDVVHL